MVFAEKRLPVNEYFYSLQGEGMYSGCAALFVRLAGCNVNCPWCDSPDSWSVANSTMMSFESICEEALKVGAKIVVITGGEPAMHDLTSLTELLHSKGLRVHLESSGSEEIRGNFDWITLSPKKFSSCKAENYSKANELKVVVSCAEDLKWAEELKDRVSGSCALLLQSEWSVRKEIYPLIIEYIKTKNHWRLSIQTHKYLGIE